jgi:hypothetical protein
MSVLRLVIVRRGYFATFELLTRTFADNPSVQVMWDRRVRERRQEPRLPPDGERRQRDRRSLPATQWGPMNYTSVTTQF